MGITRARTATGIKLTFSLDLDRPVSVVGDFNQWDPAAHPLKPRTNGKRSAVVTLPPGSRHAFRYLADGGHFFDDPEADGYEDNGYGGTHGVVVLDVPVRPAATEPSAVEAAVEAAEPAPAAKADQRAKPGNGATPAKPPTAASKPVPKAAAGKRAAAKPAAARPARKPKA